MNLIGPKAYINTGRLKQNLWNIRRHVGDRTIMCVVKANGYGHGAIQIAKAISREPGIIFGVFAVEEAVELRENGLENDIFIFSRMQAEFIPKAIELNLILNACAIKDLGALAQYKTEHQSVPKFHIKFDTGMT